MQIMRLSPIAQVSTSRSTIIVKGIIILIFLLLAELRTSSAMSTPSVKSGVVIESNNRKKSIRLRQRIKKKEHAVVYACSYKRKSKPRASGYSYYR
jgi:hypothetical protein